jgi:hypothetical protein
MVVHETIGITELFKPLDHAAEKLREVEAILFRSCIPSDLRSLLRQHDRECLGIQGGEGGP